MSQQMDTESRFTPIQVLNPIMNSWQIKAKVTEKSTMRTFSNKRNPGKEGCVFSVELLDKNGGEIKLTLFNEVARKFETSLAKGKTYLISNAQIRVANKRYQKCENDYSIAAHERTIIQETAEDSEIGQRAVKFSFKKISSIPSMKANNTLDVLALVIKSNPAESLELKDGRTTQRRNLTIADDSGQAVRLTLWGETCNEHSFEVNTLYGIKKARVREWNEQKSLSLSMMSDIITPLPQEYIERMDAFKQSIGGKIESIPLIEGGGEMATASMSSNFTFTPLRILQEKDQNSEFTEEPTYFNVTANVAHIHQRSMYYTACPSCKKKVMPDEQTGEFNCVNCGESGPKAQVRYVATLKLSDPTGEVWASIYEPHAAKILKKPAEEMKEMIENDPNGAFKYCRSLIFNEYIFGIKAINRVNPRTNEYRTQYSVTYTRPVMFQKQNKTLLSMLQQYQGGSVDEIQTEN